MNLAIIVRINAFGKKQDTLMIKQVEKQSGDMSR